MSSESLSIGSAMCALTIYIIFCEQLLGAQCTPCPSYLPTAQLNDSAFVLSIDISKGLARSVSLAQPYSSSITVAPQGEV